MDVRLKKHFDIVKKSTLFKDHYKEVTHYTNALPIEKHMLRTILANQFNVASENKGVYLVRSGGSMAKPLIFPVDIEENLYQRELLSKELVANDIFTSQSRVLNLFSYNGMYRTAAIMDDILERCNATTISLGAVSELDLVYNTAKQFAATMIIGTPSKLTLVAHYILDNKLEVSIPKIMYAGEFLLKSQESLLKKAFNSTHIYTMYGSAETGIWAWASYENGRTSFETLNDVIVEVENPDKEGNGLLVVTNLLRKRFPVFRYVMGDIGSVSKKDNKTIVHLKTREPKSFSIESNSYFLNDFDWLYEIADRFQIQISNTKPKHIEIKFLIVSNSTNLVDVSLIKDKLGSIFEINPKTTVIKVQQVKEASLYLNPTTSKTPSIADFRR
ncbi:hypothetical protein P8625_03240 [Tenacibaculum tangerinum]|uniref:AMP-dependent synthetase/ligase domain-containing protein n=1 Tax=Tenacibaculum tangerinum TaxID=3038772 RepID=A0ABY8L482_9FLAO|nr:hypothetical protein [Tenacibaculum tangerinum]WGH76195.1 hypothetical protein P8625_03240 [Tenacibaculum tangerinum]